MDEKTFNKKSLDEKIKLAITSDDPKELDIIARSDCDSARIFAARNIHTDIFSLDYMATHTDSIKLKETLLDNPLLLPSTRKKLEKKAS